MSAVKRLFQSPFRKTNPKEKNLRRSQRIRSKNVDGSSSPATMPTNTTSMKDRHAKEEEPEFLKGAVLVESTSNDTSDDIPGDRKVNEDFETTVMISKSPAHTDSRNDDDQCQTENDEIEIVITQSPFSSATECNDEEKEQESPINSVVFEKYIDTTLSPSSKNTRKLQCSIPLSPLISPCSASNENEDEEFAFDDYRSTISGLTEVTGHYKERRGFPPPSPTNSVASAAVTKKMEDFLKTETEAIRQILTDVDSGDDESTVVEDAVRGANEAERMAREMEREMELLVRGNQTQADESKEDQESTPEAQDSHLQDSPLSNQFLTDIRSVIHPRSESSIEYHCNIDDDQSLVSSMSMISNRSSTSSPRRDLFRKRSSLYRLQQQKKQRERRQKRKIKRIIRFCVRSLLLTLILSSMVFMANWKWNFPNQNFSDAKKSTMILLEKRVTIKPEWAKIKAFALDATRTTTRYVGEGSSFFVNKVQYYGPLITQQTKSHAMNGFKATSAYANRVGSYIWTFEMNIHMSDSIYSATQYIQDRLEYVFTDRAAREKQLKEERKLQELLEAAAAAAIKEKQQQLWTQTMFAGACAFVGSVATNYIWSAL